MWSTYYFIQSKTLCYKLRRVWCLCTPSNNTLVLSTTTNTNQPLLLFTSKRAALTIDFDLFNRQNQNALSKMYFFFLYNRLRMNRNESSRVILDVSRFYSHVKCNAHLPLHTREYLKRIAAHWKWNTFNVYIANAILWIFVCVSPFRFHTTSVCNFKCTFRIMKPYIAYIVYVRVCVCTNTV